MAVVQFAPANTTAEIAKPSDILLCHNTDWVSRGIQMAEHLRSPGNAFYWWSNHCAVMTSETKLVEAVNTGVQYNTLAAYHGVDYYIIHIDATDDQRQSAVEFVESCVGKRYNFVDIASIAFTLLTGITLDITTPDAYICSSLASHALEYAGYVLPKSADHMTPADIAQMFKVVEAY